MSDGKKGLGGEECANPVDLGPVLRADHQHDVGDPRQVQRVTQGPREHRLAEQRDQHLVGARPDPAALARGERRLGLPALGFQDVGVTVF